MSNRILTLDSKALARLLSPIIYKCESTLLRDFDRVPELFPPFDRPYGKKIYETQQVIDFYPPRIGAAIRRALERAWDGNGEAGKKERISPANRPPMMRSIAEELMVVSKGIL